MNGGLKLVVDVQNELFGVNKHLLFLVKKENPGVSREVIYNNQKIVLAFVR